MFEQLNGVDRRQFVAASLSASFGFADEGFRSFALAVQQQPARRLGRKPGNQGNGDQEQSGKKNIVR